MQRLKRTWATGMTVRPLALRGLLLGALVGAITAGVCAALAMLGSSLSLLITNLQGYLQSYGLGDMLRGAALVLVCIPLFALLYILPGGLIGAVIGLLIGASLTALVRYLSPRGGALLGLVVGAAVVVAINLGLAPGMSTRWRLLWVGGPSVLAVAGSVYIGWQLTRSATEPRRPPS